MLLKRLKSSKKIWIEKKLAGANIHESLKKPTEQPKQSKNKETPSSSLNNSNKVSNPKL